MGAKNGDTEEKKPKPLCGWCALYVVDHDGYAKKTKGNHVEAPFHVEELGDAKRITVYFSPTNPLNFLQLPNDDNLLTAACWYGGFGKAGERNDLIIAEMIHDVSKDINKQFDKTPNSFKSKFVCPFLKDPYSRTMEATFTTVEKRFVTRVTQMTFDFKNSDYDEWLAHFTKMKEAHKDDKDDKDKDKDSKDKDSKDSE